MMNETSQRGFLRGKPLSVITIILLIVAICISLIIAVTFGTVKIEAGKVYSVIFYELRNLIFRTPIPEEWAAGTPTHDVVWLIRLPRLILAALIGAGLSVCGVVMQAIVKNPLADPYVLGISSGASLGATLAVLLGIGAVFGSNSIGVMAFIGAFLVSMAVIALANIGGRANSIKLLLAGSAMSAICSAFTNFTIYLADSDHAATQVMRWTMGSFASASWTQNGILAVIVIVGCVFFMTQWRVLNMMLLGDESAITLGTDLHSFRIAYLIIASIMVGFAVYAAGIIGFVGLVVPHVIRLIFGTGHERLTVISALTGALYLIWADVLSRTILPGNEIPVGILTSMIGAPVFIYLMVRKSYGFGGGD